MQPKKNGHADKIKTILLLNEGWSDEPISKTLLLDDRTPRRSLKVWERKGLEGLVENHDEGRNPNLTRGTMRRVKDASRANH